MRNFSHFTTPSASLIAPRRRATVPKPMLDVNSTVDEDEKKAVLTPYQLSAVKQFEDNLGYYMMARENCRTAMRRPVSESSWQRRERLSRAKMRKEELKRSREQLLRFSWQENHNAKQREKSAASARRRSALVCTVFKACPASLVAPAPTGP